MPFQRFAFLLAVLATPALAQPAPNPVRGKLLFLQCGACHSTAPGAPNKVGPNLSGVFGAKVGSRAGYSYSKVFQGGNFNWDDAKLASFIEKPSVMMPGTKMVFGGIADPAKRADIIAFIKTLQ